MAAFTVTSSELKAKANELRNLNAQFKTQVGNLESQEGNLVTMWEGEAKNAFHTAFMNDKSQMDKFYDLICFLLKYVICLTDVIIIYLFLRFLPF